MAKNKKNKNTIAIIVDGGIIQGVCTEDKALVGTKVVIVDYDIEGVDPENIQTVADEYSNSPTEAYIIETEIEEAKHINIKDI